MRTTLRTVAAFLLLIALAVLVIFSLSEMRLRGATSDSITHLVLPTDYASIEQGRYVARTRGCFGCHGQQLEGQDFGGEWDWPARAVAPNLAKLAREVDVPTLEAAIRQGIGTDGKAMVSMPSYNFARLSDEDTASLIAFLKQAPVVEKTLPRSRLGWQARWDLVFKGEMHMKEWVDQVPVLVVDPQQYPVRAQGEYLAMTMCNECHGLDLRGSNLYGMPTPDLSIVGAIDQSTFEKIITTGKGFGDRHLGLMSLVAPDRFPELTREDLDALYLYLSGLLYEPVAQNVFWRSNQ